tara:strand:+ start:1717 stop:1845 length:129 start_codon:yes stop_codon:yes gene_type:complete
MLKGIIRLYFLKGKTLEYLQILKIEFIALSVMLALTIYLSTI